MASISSKGVLDRDLFDYKIEVEVKIARRSATAPQRPASLAGATRADRSPEPEPRVLLRGKDVPGELEHLGVARFRRLLSSRAKCRRSRALGNRLAAQSVRQAICWQIALSFSTTIIAGL